jgi:hypothetical protein
MNYRVRTELKQPSGSIRNLLINRIGAFSARIQFQLCLYSYGGPLISMNFFQIRYVFLNDLVSELLSP